MKFSIATVLLPASAVIATATLVSGQVSLHSIAVFLYILLLVSEFLARLHGPCCFLESKHNQPTLTPPSYSYL